MNAMEEATEWLTRAREKELTTDERKQLAAWLAESPLHIREYLETGQVWVALQSPDIRPSESKEQLIEAMRNCTDTNVFAIETNEHQAGNFKDEIRAPVIDKKSRWVIPFVLAASVTAIVLFVWQQLSGNSNVYKTALGEQRSVVLDDGSIVQLNTLSTLVVHFDKQNRRIELPQGEAFFRVAHDKARPFVVETPFATVRAVGTEFDVYNREGGTHVAVIEGKVTVGSAVPATRVSSGGFARLRSPPTPSRKTPEEIPVVDTAIPLSAGQQVTMSAAAAPKPVSTSIANVTAWIQRRIVLDNDEIGTAVAEFNRYNRAQMKILDPELASLRISGVFDADDPNALVMYLKEVEGVHASETGGQLVLER